MNVGNNQEEENQAQLNNNEVNANNNYVLYNNEEILYSKKYTKITLSFILIFLLKLFFYIYIKYQENTDKFSFDIYLTINYNQYYRFISRYFISYGLAHFLLELYFTYKLCYYFENMLGTLFTLVLILVSLILISFMHIFIIQIIIYLYKNANKIHFLYDNSEGGLTPLFFLLYTFYFSFEENNNKIFILLIIFVVRAKHSEYLLLLVLIFFTPNESLYGNISGMVVAKFLMIFKNYFLPKIIWIKHFEKEFKLNKFFPLFRIINEENPIMKKILDEFDKKRDGNDEENGQRMTELTLLSTENEENNENNRINHSS